MVQWIKLCKPTARAPQSSLLLIIFLYLFFFPGQQASGATWELRIVRCQEKTEEVLYRILTHPQKIFRIGYTHSWDKCPIVEVFRIEKDATITLMEEIYSWFGAGLEFNPETGFTDMKDHLVHIRNIERNMPVIPIRVGWTSGFRLEYENTVIPLNSLASPGELLLIKIGRPYDDGKD
ncbi:MAG: DUF1850 domain-containing protein [Deltaproteobacteria bacterium]|nr:DUF1850 domain-containing protein [Deltaproteobacteria bacterium]